MPATPATPRPAATLAVVLAAGSGSRFAGAGHKLDAIVAGERLADRAIGAAREADIGPVIVITGAHPLDVPAGAIEVHNPRWSTGQASSLQVAVATARERGATAIVVGLADQPAVQPAAWRAVAASRSPIAIATYGDRRGHPVRLHADVWDMLPHDGDRGARAVIDVHPDLVEPIPCPGSPDDIDTLEDLHRWQSESSTSSPSIARSKRPGR